MEEVDTLSKTTLDRVMARVEIEREAAIKQFIEEFSNERIKAIDQAEDDGKKIVDHSFRQVVILIIIWMVCYTLARLIIHYVTKRRVLTDAAIQS